MTTYEADVVIVGAGLAGALAAAGLSAAGARVLVLEAGPDRDRAEALAFFREMPNALKGLPEAAYPEVDHAPKPQTIDKSHYLIQNGPDMFKSGYERQVGGTTWHWLGATLRLLPNDFRMGSTFGVASDWPLGYDELEYWYGKAEAELGVAGDDSVDTGSWRSTPYAQGPIPMSYLDQRVRDAARSIGLDVLPTPAARNSRQFDDRPACCGSHNCIPVCPVGAKYDASVHIKRAVRSGAQVIPNAVAWRVDVGEGGRITSVAFRRQDGSDDLALGKMFIIAGHAVETPRLLLMSRTATLPRGVANSSDQVGRNLMDHPTQLSWALAREPVYPYRGPLSTAGIESLRDGAFRSQHGAFRIEIGNDGWSWPVGDMTQVGGQLAADGHIGRDLAARHNDLASRHLRMAALVEQLPDPNNRVTLSSSELDSLGLPRPVIDYRVSEYTRRGMSEARAVMGSIYEAMGASEVKFADDFFGAGHIMGTYRMGDDPRTSVVDTSSRSHDHLNLFLLGSGTFPTAGCSNPSLTIAALALRAVDATRKDLGR